MVVSRKNTAEDARQRILTVAKSRFAEVGYDGVALSEIIYIPERPYLHYLSMGRALCYFHFMVIYKSHL